MLQIRIGAHLPRAEFPGLPTQLPSLTVDDSEESCAASVPPWATSPTPTAMSSHPRPVSETAKKPEKSRVERTASVRVVVFSVIADAAAPTKETETQIETFLLSPGQSVDLPQTATGRGATVTVDAK